MRQYNYSDELYHYGVLGMKWGKKKANYSSTYGTVAIGNYASKNYSQYQVLDSAGKVLRRGLMRN